MVIRNRMPEKERPADIRWFPAAWPGRCSACGESFDRGTDIGYTETDRLIGRTCCAGTGKISEDGESLITDLTALMPTHKTAADACKKCFIIHSAGQTECE